MDISLNAGRVGKRVGFFMLSFDKEPQHTSGWELYGIMDVSIRSLQRSKVCATSHLFLLEAKKIKPKIIK